MLKGTVSQDFRYFSLSRRYLHKMCVRVVVDYADTQFFNLNIE